MACVECSGAADRKAVIKNADMSEDMQTDAIEVATQAMEKFNIEKDIAAYIKKEQARWKNVVERAHIRAE